MNTETLSLMRTTVAKIDDLCAEGLSLENACREAEATPRSYRRWKELLAFSRIEEPSLEAESIASILPDLEAEFGRISFSAGERLFQMGDHAEHLYVVLSGAVRIVEWDAVVGAGELVGEIGVFSELHRRTGSADCIEDCDLIRIPRERALDISSRKPGIGLAMTQVIADRLTRNLAYNADRMRETSVRLYPVGAY